MVISKAVEYAKLLGPGVRQAMGSGELFSRAFYKRFLAKNPIYESLFQHAGLENQHRRFFVALDVIFGNLNNPHTMEQFLIDLGRVHFRRYHVPAESFTPFGEALEETFAEFLGTDWTDAHARAWREVYDEMVQVMLYGD